MLLRPEIVLMSYLALTEKKIDGEGEQRTQGFFLLIISTLIFGEAKWTPAYKRKGGYTASNSNCKVKKNTIINPM
jgi:hypothetical protein